MKKSIAIIFLTLSACATGSVGAPRSQPIVDATNRVRPPAASRTVLIVGPSTFQEVDADLAFGVSNGAAVAAVERQMFDAGWDPVSRPAMAKIVTGHQVAKALRAIQDRSRSTYLDAAASVVASSTADALLLVRDWSVSWSPQAAAAFGAWKLCPLAGLMDLAAFDRSGRLVWHGSVKTQSTDFLDLTMAVKSGSATVNYPAFACATEGDCSTCTSATRPIAPEVQDRMAAHSAALLVKALGIP